MSNDEDWISSRAAQARLGRTDRQLRRYASAGRVRTRNAGGRVQYHRADVEALAAQQVPDDRPRVESTEIMPPGALLEHIRQLEAQIAVSAAREGRLQGMLEAQQPRLEDAQRIQGLLDAERAQRFALEAERNALRQQVTGQRVALIVAIVVIVALAIIVGAIYFGGGL
jgi:hypothetical protein